jgi:mannose-6-phosphate isomerase-like protein (cupin superfamily)
MNASSEVTLTGLPRTVRNPDMGVTVTFLAAMDETGGDYVESQVVIPAGEPGPAMHYHLDFEEVFPAVEGSLYMDLGEQRGIVLRPGESVRVPCGVPHRYYNDGTETALFHFRAEPGAAYEKGIRASFAIAQEGRTNGKSMPRNPIEMGLLFALAGTYVTDLPLWLQRTMAACAVRFGKLLGYDPQFSRYTKGPQRPSSR